MNSSPKLLSRLADRGRMAYLAAVLGLALVYFSGAVFCGHTLLNSGQLWVNDLLFGDDTLRNMRVICEPHYYLERSNIHPLFPFLTKPLALTIQKFHITRGTSAVLVNAAFATLGLILTALYLRLRGLSRIDALLGMLLMGSSTTWIIQSSVPATQIFHVWVMAALNILLFWALKRPVLPDAFERWGRRFLWLFFGVINYGYAVSSGMMSFLLYAFSKRDRKGWGLALGYGALVLAVGLALSYLLGSSINILAEKEFIGNGPLHGPDLNHPLLHGLSCNFFWSYVAPHPVIATEQDGFRILSFLEWKYSPLGWLLVTVWIGILLLAIRAIILDRDEISRRITYALLACMAFQLAMHCFYYTAAEGVFIFTGHILFVSLALLIPLMLQMGRQKEPLRRALRLGLLLFILILTVRHFHFCYALHTVPLHLKG